MDPALQCSLAATRFATQLRRPPSHIVTPMGRNNDDDAAKDWGAGEVHDWGVPSPGTVPAPAAPTGIAGVSGASGGGVGISPLLFEPAGSTPLDVDPSDVEMPASALWAMEDRRHSSRRLDTDDAVHCRLGEGDRTLYVIDDGLDHCMVSRLVGEDSDGCAYYLVGRISIDRFNDLRDEEVPLEHAFSTAHDLTLMSVFESESASNVVTVQPYHRVDDVPVEYLPPGPFIPFN
jgi:hypothetical protein